MVVDEDVPGTLQSPSSLFNSPTVVVVLVKTEPKYLVERANSLVHPAGHHDAEESKGTDGEGVAHITQGIRSRRALQIIAPGIANLNACFVADIICHGPDYAYRRFDA